MNKPALLIGLLASAAIAHPAFAQTQPSEMPSQMKVPARLSASDLSAPPVAEKRSHSATHHGITIEDPYHWMKDQSYPVIDDADVLAHLEAENAYFEAAMEPHRPLVKTLFEELKGRVKQDDSSVPQKDGDYLYWTAVVEGKEYRQWWRRPVAGGADQLMLDENELAEGKDYFRLGSISVSEDGTKLAYSYDDNGSERFTARIKDLGTGELLPDVIPETLSSLLWVAGDTALVYGKANANWRVDNARLHRLGTDVADDVELYREADEGFRVGIGKSAQDDWLIIATGDNETSEVRLVPTADPTGEQVLVRAREKGVEYDVDLRTDGGTTTLFVHTNDEHVNFRLATADLATPGDWTTLIAGSDQFYLTDMQLFEGFYVTEGRLDGLDQVQLRSYADAGTITPVAFPEASYDAGLSNNPEYAVAKLRLAYESMVTPDSVYDYDVASGALELLKQQEIPSGYDASLYVTERLTITARDGTQVPVSVVRAHRYAEGRSAASLCLWRLWLCRAAGLFQQPVEPARSRHGLCHRAYSRRRRSGPQLVPARQDERAHQHVQRFRRCGQGAGGDRAHHGGQDQRQRRVGGRQPDGRDRQHRSGACGVRSWPTCRSSISSTPCSTTRCR